MRGWDVYNNGEKIDTVWFNESCDQEYVRMCLIEHDCLPSTITVCPYFKFDKIQNIADKFNENYWKAVSINSKFSQSELSNFMYQSALLGRQLIYELGRAKLIHDKLLDPTCVSEMAKWVND